MAATAKQDINPQSVRKLLQALTFRGPNKMPRSVLSPPKMLVLTGGAPGSNTSATDPLAKGTLGYDIDNNDVYVCSAYTSSSDNAWTKVSQ